MRLKLFHYVLLKTLPIMAGYLVLGAGFGLLMQVNGFGIFWTLIMSFFVFAGSMQFVGISLLTAGASFLSIALTTLMVNARHLFYGISMIQRYRGTGWKKIYLMLSLTDETYSLVCTGEHPSWVNLHDYYFLVSLCNHLYWVVGSLLGALAGSLITFDTKGIDFAMTAFFVTVFVEQWLSNREHRPALIGVSASVLCLLLFGSEHFLIPAMAVIALLLTLCRTSIEKRGGADE